MQYFRISKNKRDRAYNNNGEIWRPDLNPEGAVYTQIIASPSDLAIDYNTLFCSSEEPDCYKARFYSSYLGDTHVYTSEFEVQIHGEGNDNC